MNQYEIKKQIFEIATAGDENSIELARTLAEANNLLDDDFNLVLDCATYMEKEQVDFQLNEWLNN